MSSLLLYREGYDGYLAEREQTFRVELAKHLHPLVSDRSAMPLTWLCDEVLLPISYWMRLSSERRRRILSTA
jgi:hypothetical protein